MILYMTEQAPACSFPSSVRTQRIYMPLNYRHICSCRRPAHYITTSFHSHSPNHSPTLDIPTTYLPHQILPLLSQRIPNNSPTHLRVRIRPHAHLPRNLISEPRRRRKIRTRHLFQLALPLTSPFSPQLRGFEIQIRAVRVRRP